MCGALYHQAEAWLAEMRLQQQQERQRRQLHHVIDDVSAALEARDRKLAGPTAPARGLSLVRVLYDEPTFVGARR